MTSFEAMNSVFNITDKNNSFSISSPSYWIPVGGEELNNKLKKLLEVGSQNDIELRGKNFEKRGTRIEIGNSGYNLAGFNQHKIETLVELGRLKYKDLYNMVYRKELTYDDFLDVLDAKYFAGSVFRIASQPGISESNDIIWRLKSLLPADAKANFKFDGIRLRWNITKNKAIKFPKKSFFYTLLGFLQNHSGVVGDVEGFVQLIAGTYKSDKPINLTGIDKLHSKCD